MDLHLAALSLLHFIFAALSLLHAPFTSNFLDSLLQPCHWPCCQLKQKPLGRATLLSFKPLRLSWSDIYFCCLVSMVDQKPKRTLSQAKRHKPSLLFTSLTILISVAIHGVYEDHRNHQSILWRCKRVETLSNGIPTRSHFLKYLIGHVIIYCKELKRLPLFNKTQETRYLCFSPHTKISLHGELLSVHLTPAF